MTFWGKILIKKHSKVRMVSSMVVLIFNCIINTSRHMSCHLVRQTVGL